MRRCKARRGGCDAECERERAYRFLVQSTHGMYTFSNSSSMGAGFAAVTAAAISRPIRNASAFERPGSSTNSESVSP